MAEGNRMTLFITIKPETNETLTLSYSLCHTFHNDRPKQAQVF